MKLRRSRRMISGLLLLWLGLLQFPLPFSVRATESASNGKDLSTPYPCMNRPCGCRSAEDCWKSCCCTTKAERIAFVLENGLEMPAALVDAADEESTPAEPKACCSKSPAVAPCDKDAECTPSSGCDKCDRQQSKPRKGVVFFSSVLKCKGLSTMLAQFGGAVLPLVTPQVTFFVTEHGRLTLVDDVVTGLTLAPPAPPPRISGLI
jgi:hypothetical protein